MMNYRKYAWPTESQFITDMISSGFAETIEGEITFINCFVHQIGSVCISQDAEGNCTSYDPRYAVDIIWEVPSEYNQYVVWPEPGSAVHWFAGWESQYATDFCEANPTSPYCTLSTDI